MTAVEDLAKARVRLVETLSGRKSLKLNAAPTLDNGYEEFAEVVKQNAAQRIKTNAAKRKMVLTLSGGKKDSGFDDGTVFMEIPADQIVKQAASRREMH